MPGIYAHYMDRWERKLATRDTNRVVRPFEWGADWLNAIGFPPIPASSQRRRAAPTLRFRRPGVWPTPTAFTPTIPSATIG